MFVLRPTCGAASGAVGALTWRGVAWACAGLGVSLERVFCLRPSLVTPHESDTDRARWGRGSTCPLQVGRELVLPQTKGVFVVNAR